MKHNHISQLKRIKLNDIFLLFSRTDQYKYAVEIRTVGDRSTYTLEIQYLEEADAGEYMCVLDIFGMQQQYFPRKTGILTVQCKY